MSIFLPTQTTLRRLTPTATSAAPLLPSLTNRRPTWGELLASAPIPLTFGQLAVAVDVDPLLIERLVAHRQPMPFALAERIATATGLQAAAVLFVAGEVSYVPGPLPYRPLPPVRELGDSLSFVPLARTVEVFATE